MFMAVDNGRSFVIGFILAAPQSSSIDLPDLTLQLLPVFEVRSLY